MIATHHVDSISFKNEKLILVIDGKNIELPLEKISKKLKSSSDIQRNLFVISPSGYGIHWPLIDEDLSINALIKASEI